MKAFELVRSQDNNITLSQLLLIITGKVGSGKSFLIAQLRNLL